MNIMNKKRATGFTLIELLISTSLFIILISLASGTFVNMLRIQRVSMSLSRSMNDISFVLEQMSREIRVGFGFGASTENVLRFTNSEGNSVSYKLVGDGIERCESGNCKILTAPDVKMDRLKFDLQGQNAGDSEAPRITIRLSVVGEKDIRINLQATTSSRITDT